MTHPTDYTESNALLHVVSGNEITAKEVLRTMNEGELRSLKHASQRLRELCVDELARLRWEQENDDVDSLHARGIL